MNNRAVWIKGEKLAKNYLEKQGYRILETNYTAAYGEADIIAIKKRTVVFVEVKSRSSIIYGNPSEAVTRAKIRKYIMLASGYMKKFADGYDVRFDIIEVLLDEKIKKI